MTILEIIGAVVAITLIVIVITKLTNKRVIDLVKANNRCLNMQIDQVAIDVHERLKMYQGARDYCHEQEEGMKLLTHAQKLNTNIIEGCVERLKDITIKDYFSTRDNLGRKVKGKKASYILRHEAKKIKVPGKDDKQAVNNYTSQENYDKHKQLITFWATNLTNQS